MMASSEAGTKVETSRLGTEAAAGQCCPLPALRGREFEAATPMAKARDKQSTWRLKKWFWWEA
jgi:hypothetical protein